MLITKESPEPKPARSVDIVIRIHDQPRPLTQTKTNPSWSSSSHSFNSFRQVNPTYRPWLLPTPDLTVVPSFQVDSARDRPESPHSRVRVATPRTPQTPLLLHLTVHQTIPPCRLYRHQSRQTSTPSSPLLPPLIDITPTRSSIRSHRCRSVVESTSHPRTINRSGLNQSNLDQYQKPKPTVKAIRHVLAASFEPDDLQATVT